MIIWFDTEISREELHLQLIFFVVVAVALLSKSGKFQQVCVELCRDCLRDALGSIYGEKNVWFLTEVCD